MMDSKNLDDELRDEIGALSSLVSEFGWNARATWHVEQARAANNRWNAERSLAQAEDELLSTAISAGPGSTRSRTAASLATWVGEMRGRCRVYM